MWSTAASSSEYVGRARWCSGSSMNAHTTRSGWRATARCNRRSRLLGCSAASISRQTRGMAMARVQLSKLGGSGRSVRQAADSAGLVIVAGPSAHDTPSDPPSFYVWPAS